VLIGYTVICSTVHCQKKEVVVELYVIIIRTAFALSIVTRIHFSVTVELSEVYPMLKFEVNGGYICIAIRLRQL